jgi:Tol biopolymer transport system component
MKRLAVIVVAVAVLVSGVQAQDQARLFKAAMNTEMVDGDLRAAIEQYKKVAAGSDRALASQALLRMAECYQKLGDPQAQVVYERVVRDFADQESSVAAARLRLRRPGERNAVTEPNNGMTQSRLWTVPRLSQIPGHISPDGTEIVYAGGDGNLFIHSVSAGTDRQITHDARLDGDRSLRQNGSERVVFSRDGSRLAYAWSRAGIGHNQLRVVSTDGDKAGPPRVVLDNPEAEWIRPIDWHPDGTSVAVVIGRPDLVIQTAMVSVESGLVRVLKSVAWDQPRHAALSPDGRYLAMDLPAGETDRNREVSILATDGSGEVSVAPHRGHDLLVGWSSDGSTLFFSSDRLGAAGLWAIPVRNGRPDGAPRLVKPELGTVRVLALANDRLFYETGGRPDPLSLWTASIDPESRSVTDVSALTHDPSENALEADWSPDGRMIAYVSERRDSFSVAIVVRSATGDAASRVLRPPLDNISGIKWAPNGESLLALVSVRGRYSIARIDARTAEVSNIVSNPPGSTLLIRGPEWSADGTKVYYRRRQPIPAGDPALTETVVEHDVRSGETRDLYRAERGTLVGLSASPDGRYIAARTPTNTILIATSTGTSRVLLPVAADVVGWTPDGRSAIGVSGQFPNNTELIRLQVDGSQPTSVTKLPPGWGMRPNRAGTRIVFFASDLTEQNTRRPREIWSLENFPPPVTSSTDGGRR